MSKRRMYSPTIVESDAFLDMPLSTQALYFHLGLYADDDGFVNPKRIMRMVGANDDDLKVLIAKRFLLAFDSGVVVIKHWLVNNQIRTDRYNESTYKQEMDTLTKNEFGAYTEIDKITTTVHKLTEVVAQSATAGIPSGNQRDPQVSIGKVSIGKNNEDNSAPDEPDARVNKNTKKLVTIPTATIQAMLDYWQSHVGMDVDSVGNRKAVAALLRKLDEAKLKQLIDGVALAMDDKYAPRISDFISLKRKMNDLIVWGHKNAKHSNVEVIS
jgi:hypothetical protein